MRTFFRNVTNWGHFWNAPWDYMLCMHTSKCTKTNLGGFYIHKLGTQWTSLLTRLKFLVCYSLLYWQWRSTEYDRLQPLPMNGWWLRFHSFQHVVCLSSFILLAASSENTPLSARTHSIFFLSFWWWITLVAIISKRIQHWGWRIIGKLSKQKKSWQKNLTSVKEYPSFNLFGCNFASVRQKKGKELLIARNKQGAADSSLAAYISWRPSPDVTLTLAERHGTDFSSFDRHAESWIPTPWQCFVFQFPDVTRVASIPRQIST